MSNEQLPPQRPLGPRDKQATRFGLVDEARRPRTRRSRFPQLPRFTPARAGAFVGAIAAAIIVIVAVGPFDKSGTSSSPLLERATAALSKPNVVWRVRTVTTMEGGATTLRSTIWFDDAERSHAISSYRTTNYDEDNYLEEIARDEHRLTWWVRNPDGQAITETQDAPYGPALLHGGRLTDPRSLVASVLDDDSVEVTDRRLIAYRGRPAEAVSIRAKDQNPDGPRTRGEMIIDRKTYFPLEYSLYAEGDPAEDANGFAYGVRFKSFVAMRLNNRTERLLKMRPHPGVRVCKTEKPFPPMPGFNSCNPKTLDEAFPSQPSR